MVITSNYGSESGLGYEKQELGFQIKVIRQGNGLTLGFQAQFKD